MAPPDELLRGFADTEVARACSSPDGAYANCLAASAACAAWLRAHEVRCGLMKVVGSRQAFPRAAGRWPYCDPAGFTHWTVVVDGRSVDWTARQFQPTAAWPEILPLAALAERWQGVEAWVCERCPELVAEPRHLEMAPAELAAVHRERARESAGCGPFPDPRHPRDERPLDPLCACVPAQA